MARSRSAHEFGAPLALLAALLFPADSARGQGCCGADAGAGQSDAFYQRLSPWETVVGFALESARSGKVFQGSTPVDDPLNRRARSARFRSTIGLGLPRGFGLHLQVGVNDYARHYEVQVGAGSLDLAYAAAGLDDPAVAVTRQFPERPASRDWSVQVGVGLQLPLGEDERRERGIRLPVDVQPAAGAWNTLAFVSSRWSRGPWTLYQNADLTLRNANTIGYRFGHSVGGALGFNYALLPIFEPGVELGFAHNGSDVWRDRTLTGTGSTLWLLSVGALVPLRAQHLSISVGYRRPLRQTYRGDQLGTRHSAILSVLYWP